MFFSTMFIIQNVLRQSKYTCLQFCRTKYFIVPWSKNYHDMYIYPLYTSNIQSVIFKNIFKHCLKIANIAKICKSRSNNYNTLSDCNSFPQSHQIQFIHSILTRLKSIQGVIYIERFAIRENELCKSIKRATYPCETGHSLTKETKCTIWYY